MLSGFSITSSLALAQKPGGMKSMGLVVPRTQLKVLERRRESKRFGGGKARWRLGRWVASAHLIMVHLNCVKDMKVVGMQPISVKTVM